MEKIKYNDLLKCIVNHDYSDIYYIAVENKLVLTRFVRYVEHNTVREENVIYSYDNIDLIGLIIDLLNTQKQEIIEKILNTMKGQIEDLLKYLD